MVTFLGALELELVNIYIFGYHINIMAKKVLYYHVSIISKKVIIICGFQQRNAVHMYQLAECSATRAARFHRKIQKINVIKKLEN
jgi:hypothetical protein